jgi:hypothetical protein
MGDRYMCNPSTQRVARRRGRAAANRAAHGAAPPAPRPRAKCRSSRDSIPVSTFDSIFNSAMARVGLAHASHHPAHRCTAAHPVPSLQVARHPVTDLESARPHINSATLPLTRIGTPRHRTHRGKWALLTPSLSPPFASTALSPIHTPLHTPLHTQETTIHTHTHTGHRQRTAAVAAARAKKREWALLTLPFSMPTPMARTREWKPGTTAVCRSGWPCSVCIVTWGNGSQKRKNSSPPR